LAHFAIDVVGDYALRHDAYDGVAHGSREVAVALAFVLALSVAVRGLRACCEIAQRYRGHVLTPALTAADAWIYAVAAIGATCLFVPGMEWLDGRLAGDPVAHLSDAFGGSLLLGLGTTILCAVFVAGILYAIARWLLAHRDVIVAIVATLLPQARDTAYRAASSLERRRLHFARPSRQSRRLFKRGPPRSAIA